jgi:hypothetical protein
MPQYCVCWPLLLRQVAKQDAAAAECIAVLGAVFVCAASHLEAFLYKAAAVSWPCALLIGMLQLGAARLMPAPGTKAFHTSLLFEDWTAKCDAA